MKKDKVFRMTHFKIDAKGAKGAIFLFYLVGNKEISLCGDFPFRLESPHKVCEIDLSEFVESIKEISCLDVIHKKYPYGASFKVKKSFEVYPRSSLHEIGEEYSLAYIREVYKVDSEIIFSALRQKIQEEVEEERVGVYLNYLIFIVKTY